jgi:hypothetical protein
MAATSEERWERQPSSRYQEKLRPTCDAPLVWYHPPDSMRYLALLIALAATGCGSILDPEDLLPPNASLGDPPGVYETWYAETEACTGVTGDFGQVRWFSVPGARWWDPIWQQYAIGTWRSPHDIYISESHAANIDVVKHEAVHDLLQGGDADDPRFGTCSGIVH